MSVSESYSVVEILATGFAGLLALAFLLQKFLNSFKSEKTEGSIIGLMHNELERMSDQNTKLSLELGKLQEEVIELNKQLRALILENQKLQEEVVELTLEISKLKEVNIIKHKELSWHDPD